MKISVVIPYFNSSKTIVRALESVNNQTLKATEIIVVDDNSRDKALDYFNENLIFEKYKIIKIITLEENKGPANARNVGWSNSTGDFVAFLDSDDAWDIKKLEIQSEILKNNENIVVLGSNSILNIKKAKIKDSVELKINKISKKLTLFKNPIAIRTVIVRRELEIKFNNKTRYMEDYEWILKILNSNIEIYKMDKNLAYKFKRDWGESGLSTNLKIMHENELKIIKNINEKKYIIAVAIGYSYLKYIRRIVYSVMIKKMR